MTNREVGIIYASLQKFCELTKNPLPTQITYKIVRNLHILDPIAQDRDKIASGLINEYCYYNEETNQYTLRDLKKQGELETRLKELDSIDNPGVSLLRIKLSILEDVTLSVEQMNLLYPIIEEEN